MNRPLVAWPSIASVPRTAEVIDRGREMHLTVSGLALIPSAGPSRWRYVYHLFHRPAVGLECVMRDTRTALRPSAWRPLARSCIDRWFFSGSTLFGT